MTMVTNQRRVIGRNAGHPVFNTVIIWGSIRHTVYIDKCIEPAVYERKKVTTER